MSSLRCGCLNQRLSISWPTLTLKEFTRETLAAQQRTEDALQQTLTAQQRMKAAQERTQRKFKEWRDSNQQSVNVLSRLSSVSSYEMLAKSERIPCEDHSVGRLRKWQWFRDQLRCRFYYGNYHHKRISRFEEVVGWTAVIFNSKGRSTAGQTHSPALPTSDSSRPPDFFLELDDSW